MHRYHEIRILPYSPAQLLTMVLDIERYPEFLPWCRAARVVSREEEGRFLGELVISFSHLTERYTSRIMPHPPTETEAGTISVTLVEGPFKQLSNLWRFTPHPQGCKIELELEFAFKSIVLDKMLGPMFGRACEKMVSAFTARAEVLYGRSTPTTADAV